ncbi:unnamed protein product [Leptidea sinapis]|uniref:Uncharacterized protein n=1 Tax=Leptidea sinapis TaxID=189913 RepID=A0A5E4QV95_9NEOP|nr:unnamed protein product [Leptidea sinapis]
MFAMTKAVMLAVLCGACFGMASYDVNEDFDMEALVNDKASFKVAVECFLDKAPCGEFQMYKDIAQDTVEAACDQCSPKLKHLAHTFMQGLEKNNPEYYGDFVKKFDPTGKYMDKFIKAVEDF